MHTFLSNIFHLIFPRHASNNYFSSSGGLYKQLTVFHHTSYEECSGWHDANVQNTSWSSTITSSKHVEDKLNKIYYLKKKCALCWSLSHMGNTMHGSEIVKVENQLTGKALKVTSSIEKGPSLRAVFQVVKKFSQFSGTRKFIPTLASVCVKLIPLILHI